MSLLLKGVFWQLLSSQVAELNKVPQIPHFHASKITRVTLLHPHIGSDSIMTVILSPICQTLNSDTWKSKLGWTTNGHAAEQKKNLELNATLTTPKHSYTYAYCATILLQLESTKTLKLSTGVSFCTLPHSSYSPSCPLHHNATPHSCHKKFINRYRIVKGLQHCN